jgi:hypothetical protein
MKFTETQIENLLRHAPRPVAPAGLKDTLTDQIQLPARATASRSETEFTRPTSWWRRWWPALAPATASLAGVVVIAVQQNQIATLRENIRTLNATISASTNSALASIQPRQRTENTIDPAKAEAEEIARLKNRVAGLSAEISQLEAIQRANENLRVERSAPPTLTQEEMNALAEAKAQAQSAACVNNLKQIGLAVRLWEMEHHNFNPPDFLSMSKELNTPKILFCPADTNRPPVKIWSDFAATSSSYEYLAASAENADLEPQRVLTRCPLHNNIGLCDGSVQSVGKRPHNLVERDGKLYLEWTIR